jgi:hypothetical protein
MQVVIVKRLGSYRSFVLCVFYLSMLTLEPENLAIQRAEQLESLLATALSFGTTDLTNSDRLKVANP